MPTRPRDAHKYQVGTVSVVGGSGEYLGATELVCRGAHRAGAGLVTLLAAEQHPSAWPETVLRRPLSATDVRLGAGVQPDAGARTWQGASLEPRAADALVAGPGWDPKRPTYDLTEVLTWAPGRCVVDAGALSPTAFQGALGAVRSRSEPVVLTPHAGEAARLARALGLRDDPGSDPRGAAVALAGTTRAVVVLKGASTVIASPAGRLAVSERGDPIMASGGMGDVLAGVLGALLAAPGGDVFERACCGVLLHGLAGERAASRHGWGARASDVADLVGMVLAERSGAA